jgi:uncharacterized protein YcaQ
MTLAELRARALDTLFSPTTLQAAIVRLGFVQADPIRAPARAQDLILRQRVDGYRAGELERRYAELDVAEDFFLNYGFVSRALQSLMHPRPGLSVKQGVWPSQRVRRAHLVHAFVRERGVVHPREVEAHFAHGKLKNPWGGSSNATTLVLDALHYRGLLRVARREGGVRLYAAHEHAAGEGDVEARLDALVDVVARLYGPLPSASLSYYVRRLRYAVPQHQREIGAALGRARDRLAHARVAGIDWWWLDSLRAPDERVRLVAPFDPVVHDRARFELLWGWVYRFEAYTPLRKRKLGYYALPILWRDRAIGWANVTAAPFDAQLGFHRGRPRDRAFARELDEELSRMREFLRSAE